MIKIAYLHGLGSNNQGPKNEWLRTVSHVFDPQIDYYEKDIYQKLKKEVLIFKPNIVIGSSMGGYFAYQMARELNIKALLFNPALHSRSMEPDVSGRNNGIFKPKMHFVFGENDEVIPYKETIKILLNDGYDDSFFHILNHAHDTPIEVFKSEISNFILTEKF